MSSHRFNPRDFGLSEAPDCEWILAEHEQTLALGRRLARLLQAGDFLGLVGGLGAGKTTLIQGLARGMDPEAEASSPTYALVNVYDVDPPLFHMDLYRLEGLDDLESIAYWDYVEGGDGIVCVEWVDRIPEAWPGQGFLLELRRQENGRQARLWASEACRLRLRAWVQDL